MLMFQNFFQECFYGLFDIYMVRIQDGRYVCDKRVNVIKVVFIKLKQFFMLLVFFYLNVYLKKIKVIKRLVVLGILYKSLKRK